jgi:hypothetical protein
MYTDEVSLEINCNVFLSTNVCRGPAYLNGSLVLMYLLHCQHAASHDPALIHTLRLTQLLDF